jgi:REP element-mobilizing transposase RayT
MGTHRYYENSMQRNLLPSTWSKARFAFGGAQLNGSHPKTKRIFSPKLPLHVVLKSSQAKGAHSFLRFSREIARVVTRQASKHQVRIQQVANAGNHIHLLLEAPSRDHLSAFLRAVSGRIAQTVLGLQAQQRASDETPRFWDARPFSRIVSRGRDHRNVALYLGMNSTEMAGLSRSSVRGVFSEIQEALSRGIIKRTPGLVAAGFS